MPSKTDIIEALLFAADRPVPLEKLAHIAELTPDETRAEIEALRVEKEGIGALQLLEMAGGYQFVTKTQFAPFIRRLRDEKKQKLSRAAFEVLAIIAYRQPATRSDIDSLRGVESAGPLQFLLEKKLIALAGRKEVPGRPWLYRTTPQFLDQFGLNSLDDLPDLEEFTALENAGGHPQTMNLFGRGSIHPLPELADADESPASESGEDTALLEAQLDGELPGDSAPSPEEHEAMTRTPTGGDTAAGPKGTNAPQAASSGATVAPHMVPGEESSLALPGEHEACQVDGDAEEMQQSSPSATGEDEELQDAGPA